MTVEVAYSVPFDYDAWKLSAPDEPEVPRERCENCRLCKDLMDDLVCVLEVWEAETEDQLEGAEIRTVDFDQEACEHWIGMEV